MQDIDALSSCWQDLQPELLARVFAELPLTSSLACEGVCTVWRKALTRPLAVQTTRKTLLLLNVEGRSRLHNDSSAQVHSQTRTWLGNVVV